MSLYYVLLLPKHCIFQAKQAQLRTIDKPLSWLSYRPVQCVPLLLHRQRRAEKPQQLQRNSNLPFARSCCHQGGSVLFQAGVLFSVLSQWWWWWWWWSTFLACLVRSSGSSTKRIIVAVSSSSSWASLGDIRLGWSCHYHLDIGLEHRLNIININSSLSCWLGRPGLHSADYYQPPTEKETHTGSCIISSSCSTTLSAWPCLTWVVVINLLLCQCVIDIYKFKTSSARMSICWPIVRKVSAKTSSSRTSESKLSTSSSSSSSSPYSGSSWIWWTV